MPSSSVGGCSKVEKKGNFGRVKTQGIRYPNSTFSFENL